MTVNAIDPGSALVLINLQRGLLGLTGVPYSIADVIRRAGTLAGRFREERLTAALGTVAGVTPSRKEFSHTGGERPSDWSQTPEGLGVPDGDLIVTKQTSSAFQGSSLDAQLGERGVTQVVIGGVCHQRRSGINCRHAYDLGYHVVVDDAVTDLDLDPTRHVHSLGATFRLLGQTASTCEVIVLRTTHRRPGIAAAPV